jgi:hypothetical protein
VDKAGGGVIAEGLESAETWPRVRVDYKGVTGVEANDQGEPVADSEGLDLSELRDLLALLVEKRVSGFSGCGIAVSFQDPDPYTSSKAVAVTAAQTQDDGHSTSSKRVGGFEREGFAHPSLWPGQSGRVLKFDGELD